MNNKPLTCFCWTSVPSFQSWSWISAVFPIPSNQYAHHDCSLCETDTSMNILSTTALSGSNKFSTQVSVNSSHKGAVSFSKNPDRRKEQIMTWMPTEETRTQYVFLQVHRMDSGEGMAWTGCSKRPAFSSLKATERQPEFLLPVCITESFNKASREPTKCVYFVLVKTGVRVRLWSRDCCPRLYTYQKLKMLMIQWLANKESSKVHISDLKEVVKNVLFDQITLVPPLQYPCQMVIQALLIWF